jgi:hypothetical protein
MHLKHLNPPTTAIWAIILLAAGFASNLFLTCGSNLVAFALVAAMTLGLRRGSFVALTIWIESQVLGFAVFSYPHAPMTVAWGIALGAGTLLAAAVSNACASRGSVVAFAVAFAAYELALAAFALASGSGLAAFTPAIIGGLFATNAALAVGGLVMYRLVAVTEAGIISAFAHTRHT